MAAPDKDKSRDLDKEIKKYRKALEEDPTSRLFAALADSLRKSGQLEEAISIAERGVEIHPRYLTGLLILGQAYQADGQYQKAIDQFNEVTRLNPENLVARKALAEIYDHQGHHEKAMEAYSIITILDPTDKKAKERLDLLEATAPRKETEEEPASHVEKEEEETSGGSEKEAGEEESARDEDKEEEEGEEGDSGDEEELPPPLDVPSMDLVGDAEGLLSGKKEEEEKSSAEDETDPGFGQQEADEVESEETDEKDEKDHEHEEESPVVVERETASPPAEDISEEEKLDLFFAGAELENVGIADSASGYVVKDAGSALNEDEDKGGFRIESNKMAQVFWDQDFKEKALLVLAHEVISHPGDNGRETEFKQAAEEAGKDPDEILEETRGHMESIERERAEAASSAKERSTSEQEGPTEENVETDDINDDEKTIELDQASLAAGNRDEKAEEDGEATVELETEDPGEDTGSVPSDKRIKVLKNYLTKIKGAKGE